MTDKPDPQPQAPLLENLLAPEVYADGADFFWVKAGRNVCITFTSFRIDNSVQPPVTKRVVVGRLVMPLEGAQGLTMGLYDYLKKNDLVPAKTGRSN